MIPIQQTAQENAQFLGHPDCQEILPMMLDYYKKIGFNPPWIGYYAQKDGEWVGGAGYKGKPKDGKVEIAYGTFERFRQQGIGTEMARKLVELARATDPSVEVTARTLPEYNFSTKILEKNGFERIGIVYDEEDGEVWEWKHNPELLTKPDQQIH